MSLKDIVQRITAKRRANTARNAETRKDPNNPQPAAPLGEMTALTEKDLESVQGGATDRRSKLIDTL